MSENKKVPFVVDLDGTLIRTDLFLEALFSFLDKTPKNFFRVIFWFYKGGLPYLKKQLADHFDLDPQLLPYEERVLEWIQEEKSKGVFVTLATGAPEKLANMITHHLGVFDKVFSTTESLNLTGENKAKILVKEYGEFDYVGNSYADIPVWRVSRNCLMVNPVKGVESRVRKTRTIDRIFKEKISFYDYLGFVGVKRWAQNLFVFLPFCFNAIFIHTPKLELFLITVLTFFTLCLTTSSLYILNIFFSLKKFRGDEKKNPLVSGKIPLQTGLLVALISLLLSFLHFSWLGFLPFLIWCFYIFLYTRYFGKKNPSSTFRSLLAFLIFLSQIFFGFLGTYPFGF